VRLARHFQANTERRRPVLSIVFLGQQFITRQHDKPSDLDHDYLLTVFAALVATAAAS
jgi:hypothetical protein